MTGVDDGSRHSSAFDPSMPSSTDRDEIARQYALKYSASIMHFVRLMTVEASYVDATEAWQQRQQIVYHGHLGKPPLQIDGRAQQRFEQLIKNQPPPGGGEHLGTIIMMGEETTMPSGWDPHTPGRVSIFRCDPIDGTSSLAHCGDGFASVITVESRRDAGQPWKHLGGAIVRSDGLTISWSRKMVLAHHVIMDMEQLTAQQMPRILHFGAIPPFATRDIDEATRQDVGRSGASVAAHSPKRRESLNLKFPGIQTAANHLDYRAGTTSAWQLCRGMLGFIVELNSTTIHDSAHLCPFYFLGGRVVTHNFEPLNVLKVIEDNAGPEAFEKILPPYIAYNDDLSLDLVRSSMAPGEGSRVDP